MKTKEKILDIFIKFYFIFIIKIESILSLDNNFTNIICIGDKNFRYINFADYSNGDMIIETTSFPESTKRLFYGLKQNGEYLFIKEGKSTPFYLMEGRKKKFESEIFIIKINKEEEEQQENNIYYNYKEYLVSISFKDQDTELYDFESNKTIITKTSDLLEKEMISIRETATKWILNNENYILFSFLSENYFHIKLFKFNSKEINNKNTIITVEEYSDDVSNNVLGESISCFITYKNLMKIIIYLNII